jgi:hypothetical protein
VERARVRGIDASPGDSGWGETAVPRTIILNSRRPLTIDQGALSPEPERTLGQPAGTVGGYFPEGGHRYGWVGSPEPLNGRVKLPRGITRDPPPLLFKPEARHISHGREGPPDLHENRRVLIAQGSSMRREPRGNWVPQIRRAPGSDQDIR